MNKDYCYGGYWVVLVRVSMGYRWIVENRAGIPLYKGTRVCASPVDAIDDGCRTIDEHNACCARAQRGDWCAHKQV
jgi:hypothetical protein